MAPELFPSGAFRTPHKGDRLADCPYLGEHPFTLLGALVQAMEVLPNPRNIRLLDRALCEVSHSGETCLTLVTTPP